MTDRIGCRLCDEPGEASCRRCGIEICGLHGAGAVDRTCPLCDARWAVGRPGRQVVVGAGAFGAGLAVAIVTLTLSGLLAGITPLLGAPAVAAAVLAIVTSVRRVARRIEARARRRFLTRGAAALPRAQVRRRLPLRT